HKHNTKKRHARLKYSKSSTTRSHVVATITTTTLLQYTFDGQLYSIAFLVGFSTAADTDRANEILPAENEDEDTEA
ncbi:hypothetical protein T08_11294, partial [Trichinella sp. T8]